MKNLGFGAAIFAICVVLFVHCLHRASGKNFWLDEVHEVQTALQPSVADMFWKGADGTPSPNPLYYVIQKQFVKWVLKKEDRKGSGWDWRVGFRIFPALALSLLTLVASLLLLRINWVAALMLPIWVGRYNYAINFAAESRSYSFWMGLSLLFYIVTISLMLERRNPKWMASWLAMVFLLGMTMLTSPAITFTAALAIWIYLRGAKVENDLHVVLILGLLISVGVMIWYMEPRTHETPASFIRKLPTWNDFLWATTAMMEGPRKAFNFLLGCFALLGFGLFGFNLKFRKLYLATGILALSQWAALLIIYFAHTYSGYFFSDRHGIFMTAMQALVTAVGTGMFFELFFLGVEKISGMRGFQWLNDSYTRNVVTLGLLLILIKPWAERRISTLGQAMHDVRASYTSVCRGGTWWTPPAALLNDHVAQYVDQFNKVNLAKHSGQCASPSGPADAVLIDFWPQWLPR